MYRPKRDNVIIADFGKKGSGKSFLAKEIIEEYERVTVIDSNGEYDDTEIITGFRECLDRLREIGKDEKQTTHFKISLRTTSSDADIALIDVAGTIPNQLIVVEETSRYVRPTYLPEPIANLVRYGRHMDISQLYIARRPSEVSREITANADITIWFRTQEPRDLAYFKAMTGENPDKIRKLPRYKPFIYTDEPEKLPLAVEARMEKD